MTYSSVAKCKSSSSHLVGEKATKRVTQTRVTQGDWVFNTGSVISDNKLKTLYLSSIWCCSPWLMIFPSLFFWSSSSLRRCHAVRVCSVPVAALSSQFVPAGRTNRREDLASLQASRGSVSSWLRFCNGSCILVSFGGARIHRRNLRRSRNLWRSD